MSWFASCYVGPLADVIPVQLLLHGPRWTEHTPIPGEAFSFGLGIDHQSSIPFNLFTAFHLSTVTPTEKKPAKRNGKSPFLENKK